MTDWMTEELPPLKVSCTRSDCDNNLHCYLATAKMVRDNTAGRCRSCGAALVDWNRVHKRDLSDVAFTFERMRTEYIRHYFWHIEIDDEAMEHARKKGMVALLDDVPKRLIQSIAKATPFRDGTQTPFQGRAVFYAQHATATCCRKCVEEWHGITRGRELTREELEYLSQLVMRYLRARISGVADEGVPVDRTRKRNISSRPRRVIDASGD